VIWHSYLSKRYDKHAPVRVAVIPFSTPANLASRNQEMPGIGNTIAWRLKDQLLASGEFPIVEVFDRQDWPRKKEEFYFGNFGALQMARSAGYDVVLVGNVEEIHSLDSLTAQVKLIDVESGITIFSGRSQVNTNRGEVNEITSGWWFGPRKRPDKFHYPALGEKLAQCLRESILEETPLP
jgi:hypothetical protein